MANERLVEVVTLLTKVSGDLSDKVNRLEKRVASNSFGPTTSKGQIIERSAPVSIAEITPEGKKDIGEAFGKQMSENIKEDNQKGGGFLSKLFGPGLLILAGGLFALYKAFDTGGKFAGTLKLLGQQGVTGGLKLLSKSFEGMLTNIKKFVIDITSSIIKPMGVMFGGVGKGLGLTAIGKYMKAILFPIIRRIPGIGTLISWAFGYKRFEKGDVIGGLMDVAAGFAYLFPGPGTLIGIGIDILNAFMDAKMDGSEGRSLKKINIDLKKWFLGVYTKIEDTFPIKNLKLFVSGFTSVFNGDYKEGFRKMAGAIPFFDVLADFFGSNEDGSFIDRTISKGIDIKNLLIKGAKKIADNFLKLIVSMVPNVFGARDYVADILGIDLKPNEDLKLNDQNNFKEVDVNSDSSKNADIYNNFDKNSKALHSVVDNTRDSIAIQSETNKLMNKLVAAIESGSLGRPIVTTSNTVINNGSNGAGVRGLQLDAIS